MEEALAKRISEGREGAYLTIVVKPEAHKTELIVEGGEIVFYTDEPPLHGRANASLVKMLRKVLNVRSSDIEIVHGARSRVKTVLVRGLSVDYVRGKLAEHIKKASHS